MIQIQNISPTHTDIAIAVGGYGIKQKPSDKIAYLYAVQIALDKSSDIMLVKIPWNAETIPKIRQFKKTLLSNPVLVCGVRFENLHIRYYEYTDPKTHQTKSGYTATATNIIEIIE